MQMHESCGISEICFTHTCVTFVKSIHKNPLSVFFVRVITHQYIQTILQHFPSTHENLLETWKNRRRTWEKINPYSKQSWASREENGTYISKLARRESLEKKKLLVHFSKNEKHVINYDSPHWKRNSDSKHFKQNRNRRWKPKKIELRIADTRTCRPTERKKKKRKKRGDEEIIYLHKCRSEILKEDLNIILKSGHATPILAA